MPKFEIKKPENFKAVYTPSGKLYNLYAENGYKMPWGNDWIGIFEAVYPPWLVFAFYESLLIKP